MRWQRYHTVWLLMFIGWIIAYTDRNIVSPVIAFMLSHKVAFIATAANPHALGGLAATILFAGYALMQFPAGYLGDRFGKRPLLVTTMLWATVGSVLTGIFGQGLFGFLSGRVVTGLGEGAYFPNSQALNALETPRERVAMGQSLAFIGLGLGLVGALIGGAAVLNWGLRLFGPGGWTFPFYFWAAVTLVVAWLLSRFLERKPTDNAAGSFNGMLKYAAPAFLLIMAITALGLALRLTDLEIALLLFVLILALLAYIAFAMRPQVGEVFYHRELMLLYVSGVATLWSLWFYGFWVTSAIGEISKLGVSGSALVAAFFGLAAVVGCPLFGWLSDRLERGGRGRKGAYVWSLALHTLTVFALAIYVASGSNSPAVFGLLVFLAGVFLFANWPACYALMAHIAPPRLYGSSLGLWNFIAEIGALFSPVVSGVLRDATGGWTVPIVVNGCLMVAATLLVGLAVREGPARNAARGAANAG